MPTDTKQRVIRAAMRLFAEKGYQATTIAEIARESEANAGSVYFFFPTKQEILMAVLDTYCDGIDRMLLQPTWENIPDPIDRVFALLDRYRSFLLETECRYGCPIGILALELHEPDPPVREKLAANFEKWTAAIESCLRDAGPRLPGKTNLRDLATFVLTTMEGGVMQARTYRSPETFDASIRVLKDYFSHLLQGELK
jgi:TetR/AcrR family transcriptional regulator, transcriptional repressor for nem operon